MAPEQLTLPLSILLAATGQAPRLPVVVLHRLGGIKIEVTELSPGGALMGWREAGEGQRSTVLLTGDEVWLARDHFRGVAR